MSDNPTNLGDLASVSRAWAVAAPLYDENCEVYRQVSARLLDRLPLLAIQPRVVLDLGCGTGRDLAELRKHYRGALVIGADLSEPMLGRAASRIGRWRKASRVVSDAHFLPFRDASVDLVVSNMLLPWCRYPHDIFAEIYRVLAPGGTVLFSTAGPDTLIEYRELRLRQGVPAQAFGLVDMHDLGDSLQTLGFSAPVLDRENLRVDYPTVSKLEAELRALGVINVADDRLRGLMTPRLRRRIQQAHSGRFAVTLELVQGHAWKGELSGGKTGPEGEYQISLDMFRRGLGR